MPRITGSANNGSYLYVDYTVGPQDIAGNTTRVDWTVGVHWGTYYFNIHDFRVQFGSTYGGVGGTYATPLINTGWPIPGAGSNRDKPLWGSYTIVPHNSNGDGNITFKGSAWWDTPGNFTSTLDTLVWVPHLFRGPGPPTTPVITNVAATSMHVYSTDNPGTAAVLDLREFGYGTDNAGPQTIVTATADASGNYKDLTGLAKGTTYYVWARTHNVAGYSDWSGRSQATTLREPDAPSTPTLSNVTSTGVTAAFTPNGNGGSAITGYQVGYGTNPSSPTTSVTAISPQTITGLIPGTTYYFRARARNAVGWGPWSSAVSNTTISGARFLSGTTWKYAVPYVRVSGVWRPSRPMIKTPDGWKETN